MGLTTSAIAIDQGQRRMAKGRPKPSKILAIKIECGACDFIGEVENATFEADVSGGFVCGACQGNGDWTCFCERGGLEDKRVSFSCPSCQYYSVVYVT